MARILFGMCLPQAGNSKLMGEGPMAMNRFPRLLLMAFCMFMFYSLNCYAGDVSYVSEWHKQLVDEGKEVKCTQMNSKGACLSWNWRAKADNTYQRFPGACQPAAEDPVFIGFEQDENGIIKIPAAGFTENIDGETHKWELYDTVWMASTPEAPESTNLGTNIADSPRLGYKIKVVEEGSYYVWIKGEGPDASADSVNYGINGDRIATITFLDRPWSNYTQYSNTRATIYLTEGIHDFNVWMREDSVRIMIIELTQDSDHVPVDADYH